MGKIKLHERNYPSSVSQLFWAKNAIKGGSFLSFRASWVHFQETSRPPIDSTDLHAFFISTATLRPRLGLLLNKTQIFSKLTLPYLTKRCLKCYLERVQSFGKGLMAQLSIFSEIRVSKLANFSQVLLIKKRVHWYSCIRNHFIRNHTLRRKVCPKNKTLFRPVSFWNF